MLPSLAALIALQSIDSAADAARRRLADLPKALAAIEARVGEAAGHVDAAKAALQESATARRALEKDVAGVDTRLARFDDHKAAVKTNQEYTALLHEIATAKTEKDSLEDRILILMEDADRLTANVKAAEGELATVKREAEATRKTLSAEGQTVEAELARLDAERAERRKTVDARPLAIYDQLLKGRRGVAVAPMSNDTCTACHVRLRPHVTQAIRRSDEILQCESCQRILYQPPQAQASETAGQVT